MNHWKQSKVQREPAQLGLPLVDPAEWYPNEMLGKDFWIWDMTPAERGEVLSAVSDVGPTEKDLLEIDKENFVLPTLSEGLLKIRKELMDGRGFVLVRGLQSDEMSHEQFAAAFWGIGCHVGDPLCQNAKGHMLGHVKDLNEDYSKVRGYMTNAHMAFHCDQADLIALACVHNARSGGHHMVCSSVSLYNEMLRRDPEAVSLLGKLFYRSRQGEIPPGETDPWVRQPVFGFKDGYFAARGVSAAIEKAQGLPGVPELTSREREALQLFKDMAPDLAIEIPFQHGDILFMCNHVTLHSRTQFEDWPEPERKRYLLRLWLTTHGARPIPEEISRWSNGVYTSETKFFAPLEAA
jgi:hypothetical protein